MGKGGLVRAFFASRLLTFSCIVKSTLITSVMTSFELNLNFISFELNDINRHNINGWFNDTTEQNQLLGSKGSSKETNNCEIRM